jgi:formyl-CoA transferase
MGLKRELEGLLVVAVEQAVAAPYCSLLLADAGARVIKVERPEGDFARRYDRGAGGESSFFAWLNRGKESLALDFNRPEDDALLRRLLARADVFLHNLAPGALARRGYDGPSLRAANPGLVTCEISGYGSSGAAAERKAYDFLVQAESGLCWVTGTAEAPSRVGISIADIGTGLTAYAAILRALIGRGIRGRSEGGGGCDIALSMFDVLADWMNLPLLAERYLPAKASRMGLTHALIAPYGAYAAADGGQILIAIQSDREWRIFCDKVLGQAALGDDPRFADNPGRVANRAAMDAEIDAVFGAKSRADLQELLQAARIAWANLSTMADLAAHPFLRQLSVSFGPAAVELADLPTRSDAPRHKQVPLLDQQGAAIRAEFAG